MQKAFSTVLVALVALAGAALAQTFTLKQTFPNPTPKLDDRFGNAVAAVGNKILVGASQDDTLASNSGAAYLFDAASSTPLLAIISPNPATDALFGAAVAAFGDDLLIGAPGANKVYLFDGDTGGLLATFSNPEATANEFGFAIAVAGSNVLIGAPAFAVGAANNVGRAYLFDAGG
ncbi:MAG: FG-GAP repeat protein, partial [bacterium]